MFSNYFKLAWRNLLKNRLYSLLNITGLAVGLAAGALVLLWVSDELSYNKFHSNLSDIHAILQNQTRGGETFTFQSTPGPLSEALRTEVPEIKRAAHTTWQGQHLLTLGDKSTYETGFYAEPDFFNILRFPAVAGDPVAALGDAGSVVITERTARKFFGDANPIGQTLRHNNQHDLKVVAVLEDVPANSSVRFDVVLPFRVLEQDYPNDQGIRTWNNNSLATWVTLQPGANLAALNAKLDNFIQGKNADAAAHIFAYPFEKWRLYGKFKDGKPDGGRIDILQMMSLIGLFILLIACVNFMNLATSRSEHRAREVGVRKVVGAPRRLIIGQFLSEALLMSLLALGLGLLLAQLVLPAFNRFFDKDLQLGWSNWPVLSAMLVLGLLTGLVAGSYPALFLSSFQPVQVLKGSTSSGKNRGNLLRRGLVTFQFCISIFLIISTFVIFRQIEHVQSRPLGYDSSHLIEIPARGKMTQHFEVLKADLEQVPGVESASAGYDNLIQLGSNTSGIEWPGKTVDQDFLVSTTGVHYDWCKTTGVKLVEGRDFSRQFGNDTLCCLINQTAVRRMGLTEPVVGTVLTYDTTRRVIGVVEDFVFNDPFSEPAPLFIYLATDEMSSLFVRFQNDEHWKDRLAQIGQVVKKHHPSYPFEFHFTDKEFQRSFDEMRSVGDLARVFGGLAIFISCLGLFGLSAFVAERRTKEIGVRKVLGATVAGIWFLLSKDFLKPVLLSFVLAAPLAAWAMEKMLSRFDYRTELSWWIFAGTGVLCLSVALLTVSFQGVKAALANPARSLRAD